jgi:SET domain-containing protein
MPLMQSPLVEVRHIKGKGRGVFAKTFIPDGTVIERVPVIVLSAEDVELCELANYAFVWHGPKVCIALGYGSLYNHSYAPNARYDDHGRRTKQFTAIRDIAAGEEITVNYNGEPEDPTPVGFDVIEAAPPASARPFAFSTRRRKETKPR